jgi:hypothetical protein
LAVPPPPHVSGAVHVPHCRTLPQPSPTSPQFAPSEEHVLGVQAGTPHTFAVPPPPHVALPLHVPQFAVSPPQPSATCPQFAPSDAHVAGVQLGAPHTPGVPPPPHVCGGVQLPQLTSPPQPLPVGPHMMFAGHACGTQVSASPAPQTPGVPPPPHVVPGAHVPQDEMVPPHPFPVGPHVTLGGQATGVHPVVQTPLMQASVTGHVPQVIAPPQPSGQSPQTTPDGHAVTGVHVTHLPPTHAPVVQVPQSMEPPQPSG